jgi:nucleoside triphosphate diphosphatase
VDAPQAEFPSPAPSSGGVLDRALALVEFLRARCDWDAAQTPRSLRRYLLEEAHEVVDAIDAGDPHLLRDELGDLLLNLAFQIVIGEERRQFDRDGVVRGLEEKMERRHPHLYGRGEAESWEAVKLRERGGDPRMAEPAILGDLVPASGPLRHAHRLQERVARVGFDWPDAGPVLDKIVEEAGELREAMDDPDRAFEEFGDLLFVVANLARHLRIDPEAALRAANSKFERRFRGIEAALGAAGRRPEQSDLAEMDALWDAIKRAERAAD